MKRCLRYWILAIVLGSVGATHAAAQVVMSQGSATMRFGPPACGTPAGFDKKGLPIKECRAPTAPELQEVERRAALNAVERFAAQGGETALRAYDRVRDSVRTQFSDIVLTVLELSRGVDSASSQIRMAVRVELNETRLRTLMQATSAVAAGSGEKSLIGMFMLAREQASVQRFGSEDRVSVRTAASAQTMASGDTARKVKEKESLSGTTVTLDDKVSSSTSGNVMATSEATAVQSSSSLIRRDQVQYTVAPAQDLDGVLGSRISDAGYEPVEAAFLEDDGTPPLVEAVRTDFGTGDDLKAATVRRMAAASQAAGVRYVLVGTVDMGMPDTDPVSGNQRIYAKVSAKVYDLSTRLPRTVVNVGPAQYAGLGPDAGVARVNALKNAGEEVAKTVIDALSNRGVR